MYFLFKGPEFKCLFLYFFFCVCVLNGILTTDMENVKSKMLNISNSALYFTLFVPASILQSSKYPHTNVLISVVI